MTIQERTTCVIAAILSFSIRGSVFWAWVHSFFGLFYIIYAYIWWL